MEKSIIEIYEAVEYCRVSEDFIIHCIESEWIVPCDCERRILDREDVARILLIKDLREVFGVNDESIPVILHLVDQIYALQARVKNFLRPAGDSE